MRMGTTLPELLVVLAVLALLTATAVPAAAGLLTSVQIEWAARELMAAHRIARFTAVQRGQLTLLEVLPESLVVRAVNGQDTSVVWRAAGPVARGVSLSGPDYPLAFAPTGLPRGVANATYRLNRSTAEREVIVSRLGRLRLVR